MRRRVAAHGEQGGGVLCLWADGDVLVSGGGDGSVVIFDRKMRNIAVMRMQDVPGVLKGGGGWGVGCLSRCSRGLLVGMRGGGRDGEEGVEREGGGDLYELTWPEEGFQDGGRGGDVSAGWVAGGHTGGHINDASADPVLDQARFTLFLHVIPRVAISCLCAPRLKFQVVRFGLI